MLSVNGATDSGAGTYEAVRPQMAPRRPCVRRSPMFLAAESVHASSDVNDGLYDASERTYPGVSSQARTS